MDEPKKYTVFVMQSGANPKDVYVAQTIKNPVEVVAKYNNVENPKTLPKPLGKMLPLTLRPDLSGQDNVFADQTDAIEFRKALSADIERQKFKFNLQSKRSFYFGKKKSIKDKQTGKYKLVLDPSLFQLSDSARTGVGLSRKDVHSYGRKKSEEWNDEKATKLEKDIEEKTRNKAKDDYAS